MMRDIAKIEVPLPPINEQIEFIKLFNRSSVFSDQLLEKFDDQLAYVSKLCQAILQEAIEGKLTAQWRTEHPAQPGDPAFDGAALLAQIQAEKQRLVAGKKIKKQKPLPPISQEEMPFELPEGWVWCRLGEITLLSEAGKSYRCEQRPVDNSEWGGCKSKLSVVGEIFGR